MFPDPLYFGASRRAEMLAGFQVDYRQYRVALWACFPGSLGRLSVTVYFHKFPHIEIGSPILGGR